jgi:hypothetical protein
MSAQRHRSPARRGSGELGVEERLLGVSGDDARPALAGSGTNADQLAPALRRLEIERRRLVVCVMASGTDARSKNRRLNAAEVGCARGSDTGAAMTLWYDVPRAPVQAAEREEETGSEEGRDERAHAGRARLK